MRTGRPSEATGRSGRRPCRWWWRRRRRRRSYACPCANRDEEEEKEGRLWVRVRVTSAAWNTCKAAGDLHDFCERCGCWNRKRLSWAGLDWARLDWTVSWGGGWGWTGNWAGLGHAPRNVSVNRGCNARCLSHLITVFNECPLRACVALCRAVPCAAFCGTSFAGAGELRHLHARLPSPKKRQFPLGCSSCCSWVPKKYFTRTLIATCPACLVASAPLNCLPAWLTRSLQVRTSRCFAACNMQHVGCNLLVLPLSFFFRFSCSADDDADLGRAPTASSSSSSSSWSCFPCCFPAPAKFLASSNIYYYNFPYVFPQSRFFIHFLANCDWKLPS